MNAFNADNSTIAGMNWRILLGVLLAGAFLARLGARLAFGEDYFWSNSYYFYYAIANNIVSGGGICLPAGCAFKPPIYPLFLASTALVGKYYLLIVVPSAMIGAGTALCAFLIGRQIFSARVGLLACAIVAFYPYYVMHDTALQETGMFMFLTALSVWLLLRAHTLGRKQDWFIAGLVLGTAILVRTSLLPFVGLAVVWVAVWGGHGNVRSRLRSSAIILLAVIAMVGPWTFRNYQLTGAPVLSSDTGYVLWAGNHPDAFSHYPAGSIDRSARVGLSAMTATDKDELGRLAGDEIARSNWFAYRALAYMRESPLHVLQSAVRKLTAAFSWRLNPHREPLAQAAYAISYVPIALLGVIGMVLARRRSETILIALLFLAFMAVTAVFFAHTSHRTYLDVYWIVFAASVLEGFRTRLMGSHEIDVRKAT